MMTTDIESLEIYVDSSVSNNQGGVGVRILSLDIFGDDVYTDLQSAGYLHVKSTQMELIACSFALIEAIKLNYISEVKQVVIYTDSKYVYENYKEAMFHWVNNRWFRKNGRPVPDATEWKELVRQMRIYYKLKIFVDIKWVKGHSDNRHNIAVDKLAKDASRLPVELIPKNKVIYIERPKELLAPSKLEISSVKIENQKISVKILACEYLRLQHLWAYKYVVESKNSPYFGRVDKIYSKHSLNIGNIYSVRFNSDTNNPRIEKVYK